MSSAPSFSSGPVCFRNVSLAANQPQDGRNRIHSFLLQARRYHMKAAYMLHCEGYSPYRDVDRALATHQVKPPGWGMYCYRMLQQYVEAETVLIARVYGCFSSKACPATQVVLVML